MRDEITEVENPRGSIRTVRESEVPADGLKEKFISEGKKILQDTKIKASGTVENVADALLQTARDLKENRFQATAAWTGYAADRLKVLSEMLREREIDHIVRRATLFTHRHKGSILAGAFIIGFALPKLVKKTCEPGGVQSDISYPGRLPLEESPPAVVVTSDMGTRRYESP